MRNAEKDSRTDLTGYLLSEHQNLKVVVQYTRSLCYAL